MALDIVSTFKASTPDETGAVDLKRWSMGIVSEARDKSISLDWDNANIAVDQAHIETLVRAELVKQEIANETTVRQPPIDPILINTGGKELGLPDMTVEGVDIDDPIDPVESIPVDEPVDTTLINTGGKELGLDDVNVLKQEEVRCTNATLNALGVDCKDKAIHGTSVLSKLKESGKEVKPVPMEDILVDQFSGKNKTLGEFIEAHPKGNYYISTPDHAMALVDGELTDTAKGTNRRKVVGAFEVTNEQV